MFKKLRQRWGLSTIRVVLVLITFAVGGSLCGYAARKLMLWMEVPGGIGWWALYLLLVTVLWPMAVMLISVPFGQFTFFKAYLTRIARKMGFGKKEQRVDTKKQATKPSDAV